MIAVHGSWSGCYPNNLTPLPLPTFMPVVEFHVARNRAKEGGEGYFASSNMIQTEYLFLRLWELRSGGGGGGGGGVVEVGAMGEVLVRS